MFQRLASPMRSSVETASASEASRWSGQWPLGRRHLSSACTASSMRGDHNPMYMEDLPRAPVPPPILKKLSYLAVFKWMNALRGHHSCEFCGLGEVHARYEGVQKSLGWAEIWIPRLDGNQNNTFYAAPTLIVHYIANHDYCPPKEFLDAVEALNEKAYVPPRDYVQKHREKLLNVRGRASDS